VCSATEGAGIPCSVPRGGLHFAGGGATVYDTLYSYSYHSMYISCHAMAATLGGGAAPFHHDDTVAVVGILV